MQIISAFQLLKGYKAKEQFRVQMGLTQPTQVLPYDKKDDQWRADNMEWYERQGLEQLRLKQERLNKNYNLANGILDKNDYVVEDFNENKDLIESLINKGDSPTMAQLQFYPIIPSVIDLLVGEFLKRNNKVNAYAIDELSRNEKLDKKKQLIDQVIVQDAQLEIIQNLINMGADIEKPDVQQQFSVENIRTLPEVEKYMRKSYRSIIEQWCNHQIKADSARFRMNEQEATGFRDSLCSDEEYWEIMMLEDDYFPRILDPRMVFKHKAPGKRYVSEGNFVGYVELMTVADVIDLDGHKMTEEEIKSLESIYPDTNSNFLLNLPNDGSYYDVTKSYEDNVKTGSLQYKKLAAFEDAFGGPRSSHQLFDYMLESGNSVSDRNLIRRTTVYWKSQKRVGHLTKIDEFGQLYQAIVSEDYIVTENPIYDTTFYKEETKDNLVFGEHIDWIWINEVWGGIKIGRNVPATVVGSATTGPDPIYLGIGDKKRPDRLSFQLRGNSSVYETALPIEGLVFSERTAKSMSLVDRMKSWQISYNMVNNQISDILIDELGTVIVVDQNLLPKNSMGEDWGKNNLSKAYVAMKNFQILPLDTSIGNTDTPIHFNNLTKLDASQTERLLGKIQLSEYFRLQALASIGITPERMGTINSQQTATATTASVSNSYAQTEKYFTQHSDFLMPRVWELIINAAQYYTTKEDKSKVLSYRNDKDEDITFSLPENVDVFPRDIDVYCITSFDKRELKNKLETLALENNTTGASLYDLGRMFTLDTPTEILEAVQEVEAKVQKQREQEMAHERQLQDQMLQAQAAEAERKRQFESSENERDRQARITEAEIRAAGFPDTTDNGEDEYLKRLQYIRSGEEYQDAMDLKREQEDNKMNLARDQMTLKREELQTKKEVANTQLAIARENQNKAEIEKRRKNADQKKKK